MNLMVGGETLLMTFLQRGYLVTFHRINHKNTPVVTILIIKVNDSLSILKSTD